MISHDPRGFDRAKAQAEAYVGDRKKARQLVQEVLTKAYQHRGQLETIWNDLMALIRMIRSWARGDFKRLPRKTILVAIAAVLYFLNPFDFIPDFIPGIGYLDDAAVLAFVLNSIRHDVATFLEWEKEQ